MSLNLIPRDGARAWPSRRRLLGQALLTVGLVGAGSVCARLVLASRIRRDGDRLAALETEQQARVQRHTQHQREQQAQRMLEQRALSQATARARAVALPDALRDIADRLPSGVALSLLEVRDGLCRIHGVAWHAESVAEYASRLQAMEIWAAPLEMGPLRRWVSPDAALVREGAGVSFEFQGVLKLATEAPRGLQGAASEAGH